MQKMQCPPEPSDVYSSAPVLRPVSKVQGLSTARQAGMDAEDLKDDVPDKWASSLLDEVLLQAPEDTNYAQI